MITLFSGFLAPLIGAIATSASLLTSQSAAVGVLPDQIATVGIRRAADDAAKKVAPAVETALRATTAALAPELLATGKMQYRDR
jgi:hypothetical protein